MQKWLRLFFVAFITLPGASQDCQKQVDLTGNNTSDNYNPCEQARAGAEMATRFSKTSMYKRSLTALLEMAGNDPAQENIVAFGSGADGTVIASAIQKGGRSSGSVPRVPNAFADLHNHPKNTPPSSGDLYGLIEVNKRNNGYATRYVITPGSTVYAFVITDTTAARLFAVTFPPQQMPGYSPLFPDNLLNEYREIRYVYSVAEESAMAFILEKYSTGVALLKQDQKGDFRVLITSVTGSGNRLVFTTANCL